MFVFIISYIIGNIVMRVWEVIVAERDFFGIYRHYTIDNDYRPIDIAELHYNFFEVSSLYFNSIFSITYLLLNTPKKNQPATLRRGLADLLSCYCIMLMFHLSFYQGRNTFNAVLVASASGALWALFTMYWIFYFTRFPAIIRTFLEF